MSDWRVSITKQFVPEVSTVTLVADPDHLISEESIQSAIRDKGFEIIWYGDPVEFRYAYTAFINGEAQQTKTTELVVVFNSEMDALDQAPFDLLKKSKKIGWLNKFDVGK